MKKESLLLLCIFLSIASQASETKNNLESLIPEAPEAPELQKSKESKRTVEVKKGSEKKESKEDVGDKRTTPMHDVMIFLVNNEDTIRHPFAKSCIQALLLESFPIIVTSHMVDLLHKLSESENLFKSWKAAFNWHVYKTKAEDFYLFIPHNYIKKIKAETDFNALLGKGWLQHFSEIGLGFKLKILTPIDGYEQLQPKQLNTKNEINIENLKSMFVFGKDIYAGIWNIFLGGHGLYSEKLRKEIDEGKFTSLKPLSINDYADTRIAGIDLNQFRNLIGFFNEKINTNFLVYDTCYGGGVSTILPYLTTLVNTKGNITGKQQPSFTIVSLATTEATATSLEHEMSRFFELLHHYANKETIYPTLYSNEQLQKILLQVPTGHFLLLKKNL